MSHPKIFCHRLQLQIKHHLQQALSCQSQVAHLHALENQAWLQGTGAQAHRPAEPLLAASGTSALDSAAEALLQLMNDDSISSLDQVAADAVAGAGSQVCVHLTFSALQ